MDIKANSNYHDFSGLASLRKEASENAEEAIAPVAKQFEALFLQMMLKSMRAGVPEGGLFSDESTKMYEEMLDSQLSVTLAEQGGIGMAESISAQLRGPDAAAAKANGLDSGGGGMSGEGAALRSKLQQLSKQNHSNSIQDFSLSADKL
ncbi:MAG: rod-binding protein [Zhongshania sp.]|uniref:rod-binding protein n=1 Tax=Zhongshania sp. TaxID=1971902 RepID=UPI00262E2928|nr:rod-binding protein [Zhongshania sp.]MDF1690896.1 rod-binding protein [Zhongshania sp.]